jgi:hypothetical protein
MMFGDISRLTFRKANHYSGVYVQQGRPLTDADWGEQVRIYQHFIRTLTEDLIGPHGGPKDQCGFGIITDAEACRAMQKGKGKGLSQDPRSLDFGIGSGRYYVNGYLCENDSAVLFSEQSDWRLDKQHVINLEANSHLVYLDVWERHIGENEAPELQDAALPLDTSYRSKIIWQVKTIEVGRFDEDERLERAWNLDRGNDLIQRWQRRDRGLLRVRARSQDEEDREPCAVSHASEYRGLENQLYRIQVHAGGQVGEATFKFSRDNGSVVFGIRGANENTFWLKNLGKDDRLSLSKDDWVEYVDDDIVLQNRAEPLLRIVDVDHADQKIVVKSSESESSYPTYTSSKHPFLRRWDHKSADKAGKNGELKDGALKIVEGRDDDNFLPLEDGISCQFPPGAKDRMYRTGDYWLAPARVATGDVEWPKDQHGKLIALPPHGVDHHYAPLGLLFVDKKNQVKVFDWRNAFEPLAVEIARSNENAK